MLPQYMLHLVTIGRKTESTNWRYTRRADHFADYGKPLQSAAIGQGLKALSLWQDEVANRARPRRDGDGTGC